MFPPDQLRETLILLNVNLLKAREIQATTGELLKWMGVLILITRFEFGSRRDLWSDCAPSKYIPAPNFGATGMKRHRFEDIMRDVRWSDQPEVRAEGGGFKQHQWLLVDDFVKRFNVHRAANVQPSKQICVDESMSRWYGNGGNWVNLGIPQYIAIDRKPENGGEIQDASCGKCGIMLRLKVVKGAEEDRTSHGTSTDAGTSLHGAQVLYSLVSPWRNDSHRIVCADSYFASVPAALLLWRNGLRFIGVIKTATKMFVSSAQ
jgi:hypothetical protein